MIGRRILTLALLLGSIQASWATRLKWDDSLTNFRNSDKDPAYHQGLERLIAGDLSSAEIAFRKSMEANPKSANPLLGLVEIAFQRKQVDKIGELLQEAIKIDPNNANAHMSWGRYLRLTQKYAEAEKAFQKAATLDRMNALPRIALGDLYLTYLAKPDAAVKSYESALSVDANNAAAHYAMGVAQAKLGNGERAIEELRMAGKLDEKNPLPPMELARVYLSLNKPDDALIAVDSALKIDANAVDARLLRADIVLAKGSISDAEQEYLNLVSKHPDLSSPLLHLAGLQQQTGQLESAIKTYNSVIKIDPKSSSAYNNLAWILSAQGKNQEAEPIAYKAVELQPEEPQFLDTLGWIYWKNNKLHEAQDTLNKAIKLAPDDTSIMAHSGIVLKAAGDNKRARELLQKALSKGINFPEASEAQKVLNELNP